MGDNAGKEQQPGNKPGVGGGEEAVESFLVEWVGRRSIGVGVGQE